MFMPPFRPLLAAARDAVLELVAEQLPRPQRDRDFLDLLRRELHRREDEILTLRRRLKHTTERARLAGIRATRRGRELHRCAVAGKRRKADVSSWARLAEDNRRDAAVASEAKLRWQERAEQAEGVIRAVREGALVRLDGFEFTARPVQPEPQPALADQIEALVESGRPQPGDTAWWWAEEETPEMWVRGPYPTREAAISAACEALGDRVLEVDLHVGEGTRCHPDTYVPTGADVVEWIGNNANFNGGPSEGYPDVSKEAEEEIDTFLEAWAERHIDGVWYRDVEPHFVPISDRVRRVVGVDPARGEDHGAVVEDGIRIDSVELTPPVVTSRPGGTSVEWPEPRPKSPSEVWAEGVWFGRRP